LALDRLLIGQQSILAARIRARLPRSLAPAVGVEDLLQETYTLVFRNIAAFRPVGPGAFANWVATIADNVVRDAIRAQRALKRGGGMTAQAAHPPADRSSIAPLVEVLALYERTPSRSASGREAAAAVEQALAELRPEYREALTLRFLQGLPVPEVAARMGRTESAVHKVCARGLQRLREALGDPGRFQSKG
jgi:RNA polymerase sigma-70 factor (ECF subfamily)